MKFEEVPTIGPGEQKVDEYVTRIQNGESQAEIFEGLPHSFKTAIEDKLATKQNNNESPSKEKLDNLSIEERKKLQGWSASYELAKIAKDEGVDLSQLSREEYADFAVKNALTIDDTQLRASPWQRMCTSAIEIVKGTKERKSRIDKENDQAFAKFSYQMKQKAKELDRFISKDIKVRQGTRDSDSWLFFGINNGTEINAPETHKVYVSVKDLNLLSPQKYIEFMGALRDAQYNGDIKIFQDLVEQGVRLNDQIVIHGRSKEDTEIASRVAKEFFAENLDQISTGKDAVVDGKNLSYSEILANKIKEKIQQKP